MYTFEIYLARETCHEKLYNEPKANKTHWHIESLTVCAFDLWHVFFYQEKYPRTLKKSHWPLC